MCQSLSIMILTAFKKCEIFSEKIFENFLKSRSLTKIHIVCLLLCFIFKKNEKCETDSVLIQEIE